MSLRVLIVEDEFLIALDLCATLKSFGHEVVGTAQDVTSCMREAEAHRPDIALMDIRLANGDTGIEASSRLFNELGVRCLFLSGNLDEATRDLLSAFEPVGYIGKPVMPHKLRKALANFDRDCDATPA